MKHKRFTEARLKTLEEKLKRLEADYESLCKYRDADREVEIAGVKGEIRALRWVLAT